MYTHIVKESFKELVDVFVRAAHKIDDGIFIFHSLFPLQGTHCNIYL